MGRAALVRAPSPGGSRRPADGVGDLGSARAQQRRAEQLAAAQHARQERLEQERLARQREQAAAARQAAWARRCRELLARWPLPAVEEVDPYEVGVFYSRRADAYRGQQPRPPYVPRAVDHELAALLDSQPLVLLKGQSRAGKSVPRRFL